MTTTEATGLVAALADHLTVEHGDLSDDEIETEVSRALDDLSGSVSPEARPEMAVRLASYRLSRTPSISDAVEWWQDWTGADSST